MTDKELRIELAKSALMGGLGMEHARRAYEWLTEDEDRKLDKIPVSEMAAALDKYGIRFLNRCNEVDIKSVGELVRYGRSSFMGLNQVGRGLVKAIDEILESRYDVTFW